MSAKKTWDLMFTVRYEAKTRIKASPTPSVGSTEGSTPGGSTQLPSGQLDLGQPLTTQPSVSISAKTTAHAIHIPDDAGLHANMQRTGRRQQGEVISDINSNKEIHKDSFQPTATTRASMAGSRLEPSRISPELEMEGRDPPPGSDPVRDSVKDESIVIKDPTEIEDKKVDLNQDLPLTTPLDNSPASNSFTTMDMTGVSSTTTVIKVSSSETTIEVDPMTTPTTSSSPSSSVVVSTDCEWCGHSTQDSSITEDYAESTPRDLPSTVPQTQRGVDDAIVTTDSPELSWAHNESVQSTQEMTTDNTTTEAAEVTTERGPTTVPQNGVRGRGKGGRRQRPDKRIRTKPSDRPPRRKDPDLTEGTTLWPMLPTEHSGLPSNRTLAAAATTRPLSAGELAGVGVACVVVLWLLLGPLLCAVLRARDQGKRRERLRADSLSHHALVEEMIRLELARGRAKMYRTRVQDEREIQRLPTTVPSPRHSASADPIAPLRHPATTGTDSPHSYERVPFALHVSMGSNSGRAGAQSNLCYDATPNRDQLQRLTHPTSDPSLVHCGRMVPSKSAPLPSPPPPPLPPRIPLRRKNGESASTTDLNEKSTQTPPWDHRHRRRATHHGSSSTPQEVRLHPPIPKPRKNSKSPKPRPRKPPRKTPTHSPQVPKQPSPDSAYVDCLIPQKANGHIGNRSPQRIYNFDRSLNSHNPVDVIRDVVPPSPRFQSPLLPHGSSGNTADDSSEECYHSDEESVDSLDLSRKAPRAPWTYLPENNRVVSSKMTRFPNSHGYVAIHDTKL